MNCKTQIKSGSYILLSYVYFIKHRNGIHSFRLLAQDTPFSTEEFGRWIVGIK
jgi:hypothetical protein